jgi:hypothetical protein
VSIASQKFISEIVNDVMQHHKLKTKNAAAVPTSGASQTGYLIRSQLMKNNESKWQSLYFMFK